MFERTAPERFDSLPDIPEPSENPILVGHERAAEMLAGAYRAGKLHHGLLFAGPPGIGKATLAFHLANHLFSNPQPEAAPPRFSPPDPTGQVFRLVAQDAHPSLLHLTRPFVERDKKFKTVITVDEIRRIHRFLSLTPHDGGYRVVIVDPADDLNISAANALLKSLEEPPPRTLFVLITHSLGRLLPTIRSRCQIVRLQPLETPELAGLLRRLGADGGGSDEEIAARAQGSVRNAILLSQFGGAEIADVLQKLVTGRNFDAAEALKLGDAVNGRDRDVQFSIFNRTVLDMINERAVALAAAGDARGAAAAADLWDDVTTTIRDAETYNLDRKQHAAGLAAKLNAAFNA
ncbi:DNA polymerase III subunit delta' [Nitratireductor aquimarinus]|uniref:DNA polymerase III subunit delta n=1 Tax=Nitratireductor aquimarinus TaxID=889300 RepID=A0ABU4AKL7_9HYPH|nr:MULTISPECIES: DNA polymerase III subunit delta' [Nitratireductor]MCV0349990.1 DNA polymerase III subunit delta' [Nitratireductor sp.]MDV2965370.1 DNA polymerase III subunit delta' [Nitratireductor aquimarinus]MDV6226797.1 DNA polymerase III subunit delta' [Nitratireductor aquimarinus]